MASDQSSSGGSEAEGVVRMGEDLNESRATKVLDYEGAVFFRVPAHWSVAKEEDGQIAIYEDREGSGTLRPWIARRRDAAPRIDERAKLPRLCGTGAIGRAPSRSALRARPSTRRH